MDVPVKTRLSPVQLLSFIGGVGIIVLISILVGYVFGNGSQVRQLYDAQSADAKRVLEAVEPKLTKVNSLLAAAQKHDGLSPDPAVIEALSERDFVLEPESIAQDRLLLGAEATTLLMRFSADSKVLADLLKRHQTMTTRVDKKELEELAKADAAGKAAGFAIIFDAQRYTSNLESKDQKPPLEGRLYVLDSTDTIDKDGEKHVKLRSPSSGKELDWSLRRLILLDKKEMLKSSGPNALRRYERRHKEIAAKLKEMSQYSDALVTKLSEMAERPGAPLLSF